MFGSWEFLFEKRKGSRMSSLPPSVVFKHLCIMLWRFALAPIPPICWLHVVVVCSTQDISPSALQVTGGHANIDKHVNFGAKCVNSEAKYVNSEARLESFEISRLGSLPSYLAEVTNLFIPKLFYIPKQLKQLIKHVWHTLIEGVDGEFTEDLPFTFTFCLL